ncbi:MAG: hypothetical protein ACRCXK_02575, partial [Wohlfahrtiimonas sp.]
NWQFYKAKEYHIDDLFIQIKTYLAPIKTEYSNYSFLTIKNKNRTFLYTGIYDGTFKYHPPFLIIESYDAFAGEINHISLNMNTGSEARLLRNARYNSKIFQFYLPDNSYVVAGFDLFMKDKGDIQMFSLPRKYQLTKSPEIPSLPELGQGSFAYYVLNGSDNIIDKEKIRGHLDDYLHQCLVVMDKINMLVVNNDFDQSIIDNGLLLLIRITEDYPNQFNGFNKNSLNARYNISNTKYEYLKNLGTDY